MATPAKFPFPLCLQPLGFGVEAKLARIDLPLDLAGCLGYESGQVKVVRRLEGNSSYPTAYFELSRHDGQPLDPNHPDSAATQLVDSVTYSHPMRGIGFAFEISDADLRRGWTHFTVSIYKQSKHRSTVLMRFCGSDQAADFYANAVIAQLGGPPAAVPAPSFVESRWPLHYACQHLVDQSSHTGVQLTRQEAAEVCADYAETHGVQLELLIERLAERYLKAHGIQRSARSSSTDRARRQAQKRLAQFNAAAAERQGLDS